MSRPWRVWCVFALCAGLLLVAMGWVSRAVLLLERAQQAANRRADLEERVRLALWRMDTALTAILIEESAQPGSSYEGVGSKGAAAKGTEPRPPSPDPVPNPPTTSGATNVLLRFQLATDGRLTSPQNGGGDTDRLTELRRILDQAVTPAAGKPWAYDNRRLLVQESVTAGTVEPTPSVPPTQAAVPGRDTDDAQWLRNTLEFGQRVNLSQQAQQTAADNFSLNAQRFAVTAEVNGTGGVFRPIWLGDDLFLARSAQSRGVPVVQGVWLNWSNLRASLLASIRDLFVSAELLPVRRSAPKPHDRMLATLPVQLVPAAALATRSVGWTPLRVTLGLAWACVLVAVLSVAVLLHGTVSLSERRGAFVSAVTHEMRTPLTTFKMYSEMLADGMVPDVAARQQYLSTLCREANRLSHLVENVLAYARLERENRHHRAERIALDHLLERVRPRLAERAAQAGLQLVEEAEPNATTTVVQVDPGAVEQILFNLVDNACKYAGAASLKPTIHLEALSPQNGYAVLRVRDHGPGIGAGVRRRLFQPFSKSADEAARSAPGVGLGLALCRRLSRSLGGDLRLDPTVKDGACFELRLPGVRR